MKFDYIFKPKPNSKSNTNVVLRENSEQTIVFKMKDRAEIETQSDSYSVICWLCSLIQSNADSFDISLNIYQIYWCIKSHTFSTNHFIDSQISFLFSNSHWIPFQMFLLFIFYIRLLYIWFTILFNYSIFFKYYYYYSIFDFVLNAIVRQKCLQMRRSIVNVIESRKKTICN